MERTRLRDPRLQFVLSHLSLNTEMETESELRHPARQKEKINRGEAVG